MIRYLLNEIWFPPGSSCPYICKQKASTVIHTNNTDHRTLKIGSKTYKTIIKKKNNANVNGLNHSKGRMTQNKQFKDRYANKGATYYTNTYTPL